MKPVEPVTVWGDTIRSLLQDASLDEAAAFIRQAEYPEDLYIQDAEDEEFALTNGKWVKA